MNGTVRTSEPTDVFGSPASDSRSSARVLDYEYFRDEMLAPLDAIARECRKLASEEMSGTRPAAWQEHLQHLQKEVTSTRLFLQEAWTIPHDAPGSSVMGDDREVWHAVGNRLTPISTRIALLVKQEERHHFGQLVPDLVTIYGYCRDCIARYRKFSSITKGRDASAAALPSPAPSDSPLSVRTEGPHLRAGTGQILIVDDERSVREGLADLLCEAGHTVHLAEGAEQAFDLLKVLDVDVALVDINMPDRSGFEVLDELKGDGSLRHIPVLMMSGLGETEDAIRAIRQGAHDYLAKPINEFLLAARVDACIGQVRLRERDFGQFFAPDIARQFARRPNLLKEGAKAEVTVLFCDIRGFSRVSEGLDPGTVVKWISDVMGHLSECVINHRGTLVDYVGDELMAMWGAPEPQPDHARLACLAALEMQQQIAVLNRRWEPVLKSPMEVGIGINSGIVHVGNTGSERKFKYGPLGSNVNLASRVQSATKSFLSDILITDETRQLMNGAIPTRRVATVRVRNIRRPVILHEVFTEEGIAFEELKRQFEDALTRFENADFRGTRQILGRIFADHPDDGPSLLLMKRTIQSAMEDPRSFSPVCELT